MAKKKQNVANPDEVKPGPKFTDFLNEINFGKHDLMADSPDAEKGYLPFLVNRGLSYFMDTVMLANMMNQHHFLDKKIQFHFLLHTVRPRRRFSKWYKPTVEEHLELVKRYYGYSDRRAREVLPLFTTKQLAEMKERMDTGGVKK